MTHENARALLAQYAVGALDLETAAEVRRHIAAGCGECFRELFAARRSPPPPTARSDVSPPPAAAPVPSPPVAAAPQVSAAATASDAAARRAPYVVRPSASRVVGRTSRATVAAAVIVIAAVVSAWTIAAGGYGRLGGRPAGLASRVAALEVERAELARRVAKLTRALFERRDTPPAMPSVTDGAAAPAPVVPDDVRPADVAPPPEEESLMSIRYSPDVLSVRIRNAALADVLREIGTQSGVTVHARVLDTRKVNVAFEDVPFKQALRRLLGVQNFLLTYEGPRPRMLEVLEMPPPPSLVVATSEQEPPSDATPPPAQSIASVLDERPAVTLSETLVAALGTRAMPLRQLLDTGINHVDQTIRSTAMREAVDALQADPSLRAAMFGARPGMDGGIFGALVDGMDTARAEEMLFYVAIAARDSQVRNDAASLIQRVAVGGTRREG